MKTKLMALEALKKLDAYSSQFSHDQTGHKKLEFAREAIAALEADIAKPVEPVALLSRWISDPELGAPARIIYSVKVLDFGKSLPTGDYMLYTTPQEPAVQVVLGEIIGCFDAAIAEGLYEAIAETTDERLKDLLERRVMHAYYKAIGPDVMQPQEPAAIPEGWKLVPIEPNDAMQTAGAQAVRFDTTVINKIWTGNAVYRAMLAAAPGGAA